MPDLPCLFTHVYACGFSWTFFWPVAVYARSRVQKREPQRARPGASRFVCVCLDMCAWLDAGWGNSCFTGVDAHAVCTCVLACWRALRALRAQAAVARTAVYGGFSGGRGDGSAGSMVGMLLRAVQVAVQR